MTWADVRLYVLADGTHKREIPAAKGPAHVRSLLWQTGTDGAQSQPELGLQTDRPGLASGLFRLVVADLDLQCTQHFGNGDFLLVDA